MNSISKSNLMLLCGAFLLAACTSPPPSGLEVAEVAAEQLAAESDSVVSSNVEIDEANAAQGADVAYTLLTGGDTGQLVFVGLGGEIDGVVNPTLTADVGDTVQITLINGDGIIHDLTLDAFDVQTEFLEQKDEQQTVVFTVDEEGEYAYFCSVPGHREAGMEGVLRVGEPVQQTATGETIIHDPTDLPAPLGIREPTLVQAELTATEVEGQLADGTTLTYFTFDGTVPAPMIRARVGDTVEITIKNELTSTFIHSIDLHAVTGPGGGAVYTQTAPGEDTVFTFKALKPGLYVYHCATPSVAHHIANGMYGMILIEPEDGLPPVDREFYMMQGEIYTEQPFGTQGLLDFSHEKMLDETPEYYVFNGAAGALTTDEFALKANVGETVRIYFGVGGPNKISSFHIIGEIFDRVYNLASVTTPPMTDVQTTLVPPGGATIVEFELEVPGRYIIVDHALSRLERGLVGFLIAEGADNPEIFKEGAAQ